MPATSPFLRLPPELRDQIYEYVSLSSGAYLTSTSNGCAISRCSLLLVCRVMSAEFKNVLRSTAPIVTARVRDFDFGHVITFLDGLLARHGTPPPDAGLAPLKRTAAHRHLEIVMSLTPNSRHNLDRLDAWLNRSNSQARDHYSTSFTTTYVVDESTGAAEPDTAIGPITIMRLVDEIHYDWYLRSPAGARREEIGKICDSLGAAEQRINHMRTNGLRMGGLETF